MDLFFLDEKTPLLSESTDRSSEKHLICVSDLCSMTRSQRKSVEPDVGNTDKYMKPSCLPLKYCTCEVSIEHLCSTKVLLCFLLIFVKIISSSMLVLIFQFYPIMVRNFQCFSSVITGTYMKIKITSDFFCCRLEKSSQLHF